MNISAEPKWVSQWAAKRRLGVRRYVLIDGLVSFGSLGFVVIAIGQHGIPRTLLHALVYVAIAALGGLFFGASNWWWMERRYRRHMGSPTAESAGHDA